MNSDKSKPETKNILLPLFKHKITGLSFLLIPGGWQRLRFWFRHRSVELVTSLRKFAFDYFQKEIFSEFFLRYYEEFCPQLYQALKLEVKLPQALAAALAALTPDSPEVDRLALDRQRRQAEVEQLARYLFEEQVERLPRVRDALCQRYLQWARQIGWRDTDLYTPPFLIAAAPVHRAAWLAAGGQLAPGTPVDSNPISNLDYESARRWLAALPELRLPNRREWTRAATCDSSGRSIFGLQSLFGPSAEWAELDLSGREELIQRGGAQAQEAYRARPEWNPLMGGCDPTSRALRDPTIFRMAAATELPGLSGLRPAASFIKDTKNTDKH